MDIKRTHCLIIDNRDVTLCRLASVSPTEEDPRIEMSWYYVLIVFATTKFNNSITKFHSLVSHFCIEYLHGLKETQIFHDHKTMQIT